MGVVSQLLFFFSFSFVSPGFFWMCLSDVVSYFSDVVVCRVRPSSWHEHRVLGQFTPPSPPPHLSQSPGSGGGGGGGSGGGGGTTLTAWALQVSQRCEVVVDLAQVKQRRFR